MVSGCRTAQRNSRGSTTGMVDRYVLKGLLRIVFFVLFSRRQSRRWLGYGPEHPQHQDTLHGSGRQGANAG